MQKKFDTNLLLAILFFIGLGLVQVYSSSFMYSTEAYGDGLKLFLHQLTYAGVSLVFLFLAMKFPWAWMEKYGFILSLIALAGVIATFVPGLGIKAGGARRWVSLPMGQRFEPAEFMKVSFPFLIATFICQFKTWREKSKKIPRRSLFQVIFGQEQFKLWFIQKVQLHGMNVAKASLVLSALVLLLKQPDFGSLVICSLIILSILFVAGLPWKYIFTSFLAGIPALYFLIINEPYRYKRLVAFLDPWADPSNKGFQMIQSMLSVHNGGLWGAGLGLGQGKLFFLPEAHTDFTLAVFAEEMGFVGYLFLILIYLFIIFKGIKISIHAQNQFSKYVALGLITNFALTTFVNMGVVFGLLPTKGLTLPFLSYGGSSLVCNAFAMGVLLNIDSQIREWQKKSSFRGIEIGI